MLSGARWDAEWIAAGEWRTSAVIEPEQIAQAEAVSLQDWFEIDELLRRQRPLAAIKQMRTLCPEMGLAAAKTVVDWRIVALWDRGELADCPSAEQIVASLRPSR